MVRLKVKMSVGAVKEGVKFQFLMVRLKDEQKEINKQLKRISIPYGAIKSVVQKHFIIR